MDRNHDGISVRRQCELLGVSRSGLYYEPVGESDENLTLMRLLDEQVHTHAILREPKDGWSGSARRAIR